MVLLTPQTSALRGICRRRQNKAPSGRELAPKATAGERVQFCCVAVNAKKGELSQAPSVTLTRATSLSEGG